MADYVDLMDVEESNIVEVSKNNDGNKLERYRQVLSYITEAIQVQPHVASHYGNRSQCYLNLSQFKEAIEDAKKAVSIDPKFVKGYLQLVKCFVALGDFTAANSNLLKVKELDPNNTEISEYTNILKCAMKAKKDESTAYDKKYDRKFADCNDRAVVLNVESPAESQKTAYTTNFALSKEASFILNASSTTKQCTLKNEDENVLDNLVNNIEKFDFDEKSLRILEDGNFKPKSSRDLENLENNSVILDLAEKQLRKLKHFGGIFEDIEDDMIKDILCARVNEDGDTLLHLAVFLNAKTAVDELIALGADVNAENYIKATPLYFAKSSKVAKRLMSKGADVNAKDIYGRSVLTASVLRGNESVMRYLLKNNADSQNTKIYFRLPPDCDDSELFEI